MRRATLATLSLVCLVLLGACTERPSAADAQSPPRAESSPAPAALTPEAAAEPRADTPQEVPPPPALPPGLVLHQPGDVALPGDKPLRVTHAAAEIDHAILYLQGMCSDVKSADGWADVASERGTVIALRPDVPCLPERPGYKWPPEPGLIETRIEEALAFVKAARGGRLSTQIVTLIGYSQGSGRAELLASRNPTRYRHVVLGGHPSLVYTPHFQDVKRVALLGGELEKTDDMRASDQALRKAGIDSRFFLLPRSHHGSYGPDGRRVMAEVLDWFASAPRTHAD